eukprot:m.233415 g.233415  ORF g.233415 m.233415 type:complete len:86 (+) comp26089_c2_seq1:2443-2700(+)
MVVLDTSGVMHCSDVGYHLQALQALNPDDQVALVSVTPTGPEGDVLVVVSSPSTLITRTSAKEEGLVSWSPDSFKQEERRYATLQ